MPNRTRPLTPAQLALLAKVADADHAYVAKNMTEYRRLQALAARGLIEAASWRVSYEGRKALDLSRGDVGPDEARAARPIGEVTIVDRQRLVAAARILLKSWEKSNPLLAQINDLIRESGVPPSKLFQDHPDLLELLAGQLARHIAKSDDDIPRVAAEWTERLRAQYLEPPAGKPEGGEETE